MPSYKIKTLARSDIEQIFTYIAQDSHTNACRWLDKMYCAFDLLEASPLIGHRRFDLGKDSFRFWPIGNYLIVYQVTEPLQIARVLSNYRNLSELL